MFGCGTLIILAILNTIHLKKLKKKYKNNIPKLSELHRKEFLNYMDYLTKDL